MQTVTQRHVHTHTDTHTYAHGCHTRACTRSQACTDMHTCARTPAYMRARCPSGQPPIRVTPLSALPSPSPSPASRGQLCMDTSGCSRGAPGAFPVLARLCHLSGCNTVPHGGCCCLTTDTSLPRPCTVLPPGHSLGP